MSARWRRNKKCSRQSRIIGPLRRTKEKHFRQIFGDKNPRTKRHVYPYKCKVSRIQKQRRWREPKPLVDVFEEKGEVVVVAEFVGFNRESLRIRIKDQRVTLSAEALDHKYYKSLNLPNRVIPHTQRTAYKNGVLEIRFKKAVQEKVIDKVAG